MHLNDGPDFSSPSWNIRGLGEMAGAGGFFGWLWILIQGLCQACFDQIKKKDESPVSSGHV